MEPFMNLLRSLPMSVYAIAGALFLLVLMIFLLLLRRKQSELPEAREMLARFSRRPNRKKAQLIIDHYPDEGLFTVFCVALEKKKIATLLLAWIERSDDFFALRRLALSGKGELFDGEKARNLFSEHLDRIRELTGDPEWAARYLAVKILLHDDDHRSFRSIEELFHDPHPLIRKTIAEEYTAFEDAGTFQLVLDSYLCDDAAYEVRKSAAERLEKDFQGRKDIIIEDLSEQAVIHICEQLKPAVPEDRSLALLLLDDDRLEIRYAAARFLEEAGVLDELFLKMSEDDSSLVDRNRRLLSKAVEVQVCAFLEKAAGTNEQVCLETAIQILRSSGRRGLIAIVAEKVFSSKMQSLLPLMLDCIEHRGGEAAVILMAAETERRCKDGDPLAVDFLKHLPGGYEHIVMPMLLRLLKRDHCSYRDALHDAFLRYESSLFLRQLFDILKGGRSSYSHTVRISALILLGKLKLSYCMQFLLEQMPVLPFEEARDFSLHLKEYAGKLFEQRVLESLDLDDGKVRAALICAIPATGLKSFLKPIRQAVSDADPEVRRAAVWALLDYGDQRSVNSSVDLLRDPVERVRMEAARALGSRGGEKVLDQFHDLLLDQNEVDTVKKAAIKGLAASSSARAVDLLVEGLSREDSLQASFSSALSLKRDSVSLTRMVEQLKDAEPRLRELILESFREMGEEGESVLLQLLKEEIGSLKSSVSEALEASGFVEHCIRDLNHRDPKKRKDAAAQLALIGTKAAFRGIVLASRDPDQDVRVMVAKALEKLGSESGKEILEELKQDPDKRIRKYTLWALERLKAKELE